MSAPSANPGGEVLVYEAPDGSARVDVRLEREMVWLTQDQMAELFESSIDNVGLHLKNIFADGELDEPATTEDFSVVQSEGGRQVRRRLKHYNLAADVEGCAELQKALQQSSLPMLVETHAWACLAEGNHRNIEREYAVIHEANPRELGCGG